MTRLDGHRWPCCHAAISAGLMTVESHATLGPGDHATRLCRHADVPGILPPYWGRFRFYLTRNLARVCALKPQASFNSLHDFCTGQPALQYRQEPLYFALRCIERVNCVIARARRAEGALYSSADEGALAQPASYLVTTIELRRPRYLQF